MSTPQSVLVVNLSDKAERNHHRHLEGRFVAALCEMGQSGPSDEISLTKLVQELRFVLGLVRLGGSARRVVLPPGNAAKTFLDPALNPLQFTFSSFAIINSAESCVPVVLF